MNSITLTGRLTRDPQMIKTGNIVNFSLAVKETKDKTFFFNCSAFDKTAENVLKYTQKGSHVLVNGKVVINEKNGTTYYNVRAYTVEFLGSKNETETTTYQGTKSDFKESEFKESEYLNEEIEADDSILWD